VPPSIPITRFCEGISLARIGSHRPLAEVDPEIAEVLQLELGRQRDHLEMIAAESFVPRAHERVPALPGSRPVRSIPGDGRLPTTTQRKFMMTVHSSDVIDSLVGITPGDSLDRLRENRSEARHHAEGAFRALFSPSRPGAVSPSERLSVAVFVAVLHQVYSAIDYYSLLLRAAEGGGESLLAVVLDGARGAQTTGPFGRRDALDSQSVEVSEWVLDRENVTDRIASALE